MAAQASKDCAAGRAFKWLGTIRADGARVSVAIRGCVCVRGLRIGCGASVIRLKVVNKALEFGVQEVRSEFVLLHFLKRLICVPSIFRHAIDRRHDARAMFSSHAVDVNRLVRRIFHQGEKLLYLVWGGRRAGCHGDMNILHAHPLNGRYFLAFLIIDEVDDGFHAKRREIVIVLAFRLRATIVILIDLPKVLDVNAGKRDIRMFDRTGWIGLAG